MSGTTNKANRHVLWEPSEVKERMVSEFTMGMAALDELQAKVEAAEKSYIDVMAGRHA